jgi:hypothetical protein
MYSWWTNANFINLLCLKYNNVVKLKVPHSIKGISDMTQIGYILQEKLNTYLSKHNVSCMKVFQETNKYNFLNRKTSHNRKCKN